VLEVSDDEVQIDFNHPLAGDDLFFTGNVIEIREASNTEIEHGHVHGEGHHHHH
jgi:FKBP-type peptidyl-prolyl cis-trans isomerase SlyD